MNRPGRANTPPCSTTTGSPLLSSIPPSTPRIFLELAILPAGKLLSPRSALERLTGSAISEIALAAGSAPGRRRSRGRPRPEGGRPRNAAGAINAATVTDAAAPPTPTDDAPETNRPLTSRAPAATGASEAFRGAWKRSWMPQQRRRAPASGMAASQPMNCCRCRPGFPARGGRHLCRERGAHGPPSRAPHRLAAPPQPGTLDGRTDRPHIAADVKQQIVGACPLDAFDGHPPVMNPSLSLVSIAGRPRGWRGRLGCDQTPVPPVGGYLGQRLDGEGTPCVRLRLASLAPGGRPPRSLVVGVVLMRGFSFGLCTRARDGLHPRPGVESGDQPGPFLDRIRRLDLARRWRCHESGRKVGKDTRAKVLGELRDLGLLRSDVLPGWATWRSGGSAQPSQGSSRGPRSRPSGSGRGGPRRCGGSGSAGMADAHFLNRGGSRSPRAGRQRCGWCGTA